MDMTKDLDNFGKTMDRLDADDAEEQYEASDYTIHNTENQKTNRRSLSLSSTSSTMLEEQQLEKKKTQNEEDDEEMQPEDDKWSMAKTDGNAEEGDEPKNMIISEEQTKSEGPTMDLPISTSAAASGSASAVADPQMLHPLTPPPRPLTSSSEVVGLSEHLTDPEMRIDVDTKKKSRSLPVSPQPQLGGLAATAAALFEFGQAAKRETKQKINMPTATHQRRHGIGLSKGGSMSGGVGGDNQQFCLRWNNYQSNLTNVFDELLQNESFVDVTLACEGHSIKAHKMVLSACSPYFQALFYDNPCQHPIIIMRDVNWSDLKALVEFMYKGEINVCQDQINPLLKVAETLKIRGLAEVSAGASAPGPGGATSASTSSALHLPEQRMTVYDDDEDEEELAAAAALLRSVDNEDDDELIKPKRARLLAKLQQHVQQNESALDLNQRNQRKRSRDGQYATPSPTSMRLASPSQGAAGSNTTSSGAGSSGGQQTSTIVRNPFASPNPQSLQSSAASSSSTNSTGNTSTTNSSNPHNSSNSNNNHSSSHSSASSTSAYHRSSARSCSPPTAPTNGSSSSSHTANILNSPTHPAAQAAALPPHMAAAVAAAAHHHHANANAPPPPPPPSAHGVPPPPSGPPSTSSSSLHHHQQQQHAAAAAAAQQLAAQHQLAHSHAAMASALGASLAAAAAGGAAAPGVGSSAAASGNSGGVPTSSTHHDDMEIKPEIAEMIREEERAKMIESGGHGWMGAAAATGTSVADSYQYQLQSMWQKCWNTNQQNLVQQLRFRERGPLKSWRPEAMAEAIFSVLKEGLSLSQAARKYDIPYPTFVLYANRVHNMLGPSLDGGTDPRPKARGRPQRILLGMWPEELIRSVIKAVVFRDYREIKEDIGSNPYANGQAHGSHFVPGSSAANGYHSAAAKMAAQNAALAPPDGSSPLSSMTESLRRQILSQQQQQQLSPHGQSMNMYKSPAYLQRSEIEDQVSAAAAVAAAAKHQQQSDRRVGSENLPDLSALGLMGLPGLNVMPSQPGSQQRGGGGSGGGGGGGGGGQSAASYARELSRERELSRDRELKEAMQARQYGNQSRGSNSSSGGGKSGPTSSGRPGAAASPYSSSIHYASKLSAKEHPSYAYNKRFLESLPAGIDFEAIANGLLQKSVNKSPRFEDFFQGQDMSELFANTDAAAAAAAAAAYAPASVRESPLMKIKLEQQQAAEMPHED